MNKGKCGDCLIAFVFFLSVPSPVRGDRILRCLTGIQHVTSGMAAEGTLFRSSRTAAIKEKVESLLPQLEALAMENHCTLSSNVCRGASGTLQFLLRQNFQIETEGVTNTFHTFLRIRGASAEEDLYIDPTIQQFIPEKNRALAPKVFIGTSRELLQTLKALGAPEVFIGDYLTVSAERELPRFRPSLKD